MLRSLFSGVSGLRGHQTMMDVVGNNIANVNTTGYKSTSAVFQDLLSQTLQGASSPAADNGGTNPVQVGLGSRVAAITTSLAQGALQVTGRSTDIGIQGDGYFVVSQNGQQVYTRAGAFDFDASGNLVTPSGALVQGWSANPTTHVISTTGAIGALTMPPGQLLAPVATSEVKIRNMLSADAAAGATVTIAQTVYDTQGIATDVKFTFTRSATAHQWTLAASDAPHGALGTCTLTFDPTTGRPSAQTPTPFTIQPSPAAATFPAITINFGDPTQDADALVEYGGKTTVSSLGQNGSPAGSLQSFKISDDGVVTGVFSNGRSMNIGQIAMANFNNPGGLEKAGSSQYRMTPNSGVPMLGVAGSGGRGRLAAGALEMSNVDLAQEFTNLIIAQRGFQANSKVITSSDEMLQDLLNLKR